MKHKNNKDKGDFLEDIYYIFEKSLDGNKDKIMKKNIKLPDRDGVLREIDIYIEYRVDPIKVAKYAVECKNYKRAVSVKEITDFYSKLEGTEVNGIFVTTSQFQKAAIEKAKKLGIRLYKFKQVESGEGINRGFFFQKNFRIADIKIRTDNPDFTSDKFLSILKNCTDCRNSYMGIIKNSLMPTISKHLPELLSKYYPTWDTVHEIQNHVGFDNAKKVAFIAEMTPDCGLIHEDEFLRINYLVVLLLVWEELTVRKNSTPYIYQLLEQGSDNVLASISPSNFEIEGIGVLGALIQVTGNDKKSMGIADPKNIEDTTLHNAVSIHVSKTGLKELHDNNPG